MSAQLFGMGPVEASVGLFGIFLRGLRGHLVAGSLTLAIGCALAVPVGALARPRARSAEIAVVGLGDVRGSGPLVAVDSRRDAALMWDGGVREVDSQRGGPLRYVPRSALLPNEPDAVNDGGDGLDATSLTYLRPGVLAAGVTEEFDYDHGGEANGASVTERVGDAAFGPLINGGTYGVVYDLVDGAQNLVSNGRGSAVFLTQGTAGSSPLTDEGVNTGAVTFIGTDGRFGPTQDPIRSLVFAPFTGAVNRAGRILVGFQEHDDSVVGPAGPVTRVVLATPTATGTLRRSVVAGAATRGLSGQTAIAWLNNSTAVLAWTFLNAGGQNRLVVATIDVARPRAVHIRVLSPPGTTAGRLRAWSTGRGGAIITWVSRDDQIPSGRVMALLDPGSRANVPTAGHVVGLSRPGTLFTGPTLTGNGHGQVVVAWTRDGQVEAAAGSLANRLSTRRVLDPTGTGLTLNSTPAPFAMLAWSSSGHIRAARVSFP